MLNRLVMNISFFREKREKDKREYKIPCYFIHRFGFWGLAGCSRTNKLWSAKFLKELLEQQTFKSENFDKESAKIACKYLKEGREGQAAIADWEKDYSTTIEEFLALNIDESKEKSTSPST